MASSYPLFQAASEYITSCPAAASLSIPSKLRLYGLYKFLTTNQPCPPSPRPGFWDQAGRSKWDAWEKVGKEYAGQDEGKAREEYIEIGKGLGFNVTEDSLKSSNSDSESIDLENLSDSSSEPGSPRKGKQGGGGGMGNTVSTLCAVPSDGDEQKPHVYVVEKDLAGLRAWLEGEKVGLDGLDAFGYTALHLAADRNDDGSVRLLLSKGADPLVRDEAEEGVRGMTAREMAVMNGEGWESVVKLLGEVEDWVGSST